MRERAAAFFRRAAADPRRAELGLYAANGTYYLFLSLGPLTALLMSLVPYTPLTERELLVGVLAHAPAALRQLVTAIVENVLASSPAALPAAAALELWSGARFLGSIVRGVGAIRGGGGGYIRSRALGAVFTAALALCIAGDLTLLLFGRRLAAAVPALAVVLRLRVIILLAALTLGNVLLYRAASRGGGYGRLVPGAAGAAAGWMIFTRLYSWALERFGLFGVYGSIAAVAASLYWMYGSVYILLLGAWLGAV